MDPLCEKYAFIGDWFDHHTSTTKKFLIHFFPSDSSVDLYDIKNKKTFLRRTPIPDMSLTDFYIGGVVKVFGRKINITDFGSEDTRNLLKKAVERTFAMFTPGTCDKIGNIIDWIITRGFRIGQLRMSIISKETALGNLRFEKTFEDPHSDLVVLMELIGDNAFEKWSDEITLSQLKLSKNGTVRWAMGNESTENTFYASLSPESSVKDLAYYFPSDKTKSHIPPNFPTLVNCTCCVVKPHAIREGNLGKIISAISGTGYRITAMRMFYLENSEAAEFYEVYKGVIPEYSGMVSELSSGPCVAMEIVGNDDTDTPTEFRKLVGPHDPEIAKQLRPNTLRAKFGSNKIQNAVHCSDLPEDGKLEVEYFFKIMD